jgi:hypothetical protein
MNVDPRRLGHWSRVAFAARCARRVQPLFEEAWPDATEKRKEAVERAIALAELAATQRQPVKGLKEAVLDACAAAGRAQVPHLHQLPLRESEPAPRDPNAAVIASLSAKVAEKAAVTAAAEPAKSAEAAREAYYFAVDALREAQRLGLVEVMEADFAALLEADPQKPWWRFW